MKYTINDFSKRIGDVIVAQGQYETDGKLNINHSSILTKLIQEAGKCNRYSSDLFYSWEYILQKLKDKEISDSETFLFGFRENGVDGNGYILARFENACMYGDLYRKIYRLDITSFKDALDYDEIKMQLYEVNNSPL